MSAVLASDIFAFDDGDDGSVSVSPTNALFPPSLSFPGLDIDSMDSAYLSPNSLSPRSSDLTHPSLSPHTAGDSPRSNLSLATDEFLLNNSFASDELDMLIFPEDAKPDVGGVDSLIPTINVHSVNGSSPFDLKPPVSPLPYELNRKSALEPAYLPGMTVNHVNLAQHLGANPPMPFDGILEQWRLNMAAMAAQSPTPWMHPQPQVAVYPAPAASAPAQQQAPQPMRQPAVEVTKATPTPSPKDTTPPPSSSSGPTAGATATANPAPRRSAPNAPLNGKAPSTSPPANVGKHNKTERRYRQKVQQAQADLRDAVPALRVLYGTSSEEQRQTTDIRAPDGTVDGLGEVTRPNASAKATILIGAKMYIELLQRRTATLQRKVAELEAWRQQVGGVEDLNAWRSEFDRREAIITAQAIAAAAAQESSDGPDSDEDEEEEVQQPTRKRARTTKKKEKSESKANAGVRAFAAFAVSFSMMPSATKLFKAAPVSIPSGQAPIYDGPMSRNQVITRLPLITAEHSSRLLARALPATLVPEPHTIVDWTFRILLALAFVSVIVPILDRLSGKYQDKKTGAGNMVGLGKDLLRLTFGSPVEPSSEWKNLAARIVGGVVQPPALVRWHVAIKLRQASNDPYNLALHALLAPHRSSANVSWTEARTKCEPDSPLAVVLALPLEEASRSLELVPPTSAPIASIAEQINLVHLYDLYTRFFIRLVNSVGDATSLAPMLHNVQTSNLRTELAPLGREIRGALHGMPKHSPSHALSLVLLGLWGLFSGYSQPAVLVSALAAEEVQGAGASLSSVSAMLELLYPGSSNRLPPTATALVPTNAQAIDKLAMACIGFVDMLFSSSKLDSGNATHRLEASQRVQKEAARLRLVLTQAAFVGLDEEDEEDEAAFDDARQRLVAVLCSIGRRAAGRGASRDDDSGVDDDEW